MAKKGISASNSFTAGQIKLLRHILAKLPSMPGQRVIIQNLDYPDLCRKVRTMAKKVEREEQARLLEERTAQLSEDT